MFVGIVEVI